MPRVCQYIDSAQTARGGQGSHDVREQKKIKRPYIVHADTECALVPTGLTDKTQTHVPTSACFYFVCDYSAPCNWLCYGIRPNCIVDLLVELTKLSDECIAKMKNHQEMKMTAEDLTNFKNSTHCSICSQPFKEKEMPCEDHCHRTGCFKGATHQSCHLTHFNNRYLPVVMHNIRGYDTHLISKEAC